MAAASGPIVSPLSPAVKRSTRKRQRPTFFAEEIEATTVSTSATSRKHSSRTARQRQQQQPSQRMEPATKRQHAHRSDISQLHDTVSDLRAQIESATIQMQELRSLVGMLADLYREEQDANEEEDIFSTPLSPLLE